jgi:hypothetical protein
MTISSDKVVDFVIDEEDNNVLETSITSDTPSDYEGDDDFVVDDNDMIEVRIDAIEQHMIHLEEKINVIDSIVRDMVDIVGRLLNFVKHYIDTSGVKRSFNQISQNDSTVQTAPPSNHGNINTGSNQQVTHQPYNYPQLHLMHFLPYNNIQFAHQLPPPQPNQYIQFAQQPPPQSNPYIQFAHQNPYM